MGGVEMLASNINTLIGDFLNGMQLIYSESQIIIYKLGMKRFNEFFSARKDIDSISSIERIDIEKFIEYLWNVPYGNDKIKLYRPNFVYRNLHSVYKFFEYLIVHENEYERNDIPKNDLIHRSDFPAPNRRSVKHFPLWFDLFIHDEILNRKVSIFKNQFSLKSKTQLLLFYHTGLRISDLLRLNVDCITKKYDRYWMKIYSNKVKREYEIPIVNELYKVIEEYIEEYLDEIMEAPDYYIPRTQYHYKLLFPITKSLNNAKNNLSSVLKRFCIKAIDKAKKMGYDTTEIEEIGFSSHKFRHNAAIRLARLGADPLMIAEFLGHKDLSMAQAYIQEDEAYIDEVMKQLSDEGILEGARIKPGPEMWERNLIMEHKGIVKKVETGWCTYINGESPCGDNPYICWQCEKLQPSEGEEYLNYLMEQKTIHLELLRRNEELCLQYPLEEEKQVISRIDEFIKIVEEKLV